MKNINFKNLGKSLLLLVLIFIILPILVSLVFAPFVHLNDQNNQKIVLLLNILVYLIGITIIFIIYRKSIIKEWHSYIKNFKKYIKIAFKNWGLGLLFMVIFNIIATSIVGSLASNEAQNREILNELPIISTITMVFMGPILEELLFRKNFKNAFNNKQLFLICTAFLFGLAHVINYLDNSLLEILYILPYSSLGYFFAKAYYETDCIFTSITCHMLHNGLSIFLILLSSLLV